MKAFCCIVIIALCFFPGASEAARLSSSRSISLDELRLALIFDNDALTQEDGSGHGNICVIDVNGTQITCIDSPSLVDVFQGPFTLMFWVKVFHDTPATFHVSKGPHVLLSPSAKEDLMIDTNYQRQNSATFDGILSPGDWRHVAVVSTGELNNDGDQIGVYLDGVTQAPLAFSWDTVSEAVSDAGEPLRIGGTLYTLFSDIFLFARVLSDSEILESMKGVLPPTTTTTSTSTTTTSTTTTTTTTTTVPTTTSTSTTTTTTTTTTTLKKERVIDLEIKANIRIILPD